MVGLRNCASCGGKREPLQRDERQQLDANTARLQTQVRKVRGTRGLGNKGRASDAVVLAVIGWANAGTGGTVVLIMRQLQKRQQAEVGGSVGKGRRSNAKATLRWTGVDAVSRTTVRPKEEKAKVVCVCVATDEVWRARWKGRIN